MFIKIALSAAIVLGAAAMASAATKSNKIAVHRSGPPAQSTVPRTPRFSNPDSPAATGGGSLGYNQNITTGDEKVRLNEPPARITVVQAIDYDPVYRGVVLRASMIAC
jgi:hypothetical protein